MRAQSGRIVIALVLILVGVAALLDSLGLVQIPFVINGPSFISIQLVGDHPWPDVDWAGNPGGGSAAGPL